MHTLEERLHHLERAQARFRLVGFIGLLLLPMAMVLAGAGLRQATPVISERVVTRSVVIVDENDKPRINLGVNSTVGAHVFIRDASGNPMLAFASSRDSGSITVLDGQGQALAVLSESSTGDGLLRLSDDKGRIIARLGRWSGRTEAGLQCYGPADDSTGLSADP